MIRSGGNRPDSRFSNLSAFFCLSTFFCLCFEKKKAITLPCARFLSTLLYLSMPLPPSHHTQTVYLDLSACLTVRGTKLPQTSIRVPTAAGSPLFSWKDKSQKSPKKRKGVDPLSEYKIYTHRRNPQIS